MSTNSLPWLEYRFLTPPAHFITYAGGLEAGFRPEDDVGSSMTLTLRRPARGGHLPYQVTDCSFELNQLLPLLSGSQSKVDLWNSEFNWQGRLTAYRIHMGARKCLSFLDASWEDAGPETIGDAAIVPLETVPMLFRKKSLLQIGGFESI